jgi:hypothetical protein
MHFHVLIIGLSVSGRNGIVALALAFTPARSRRWRTVLGGRGSLLAASRVPPQLLEQIILSDQPSQLGERVAALTRVRPPFRCLPAL